MAKSVNIMDEVNHVFDLDLISMSDESLSWDGNDNGISLDKEIFFEEPITQRIVPVTKFHSSTPAKSTATATQNVPRMVSFDSMTRMDMHNKKTATPKTSTPYDSLKMLVKSKNSCCSKKRSLSAIPATKNAPLGVTDGSSCEIASVFSKPSAFLRQALHNSNKNAEQPLPRPIKKRKTEVVVRHEYRFQLKEEKYGYPLHMAIQRQAGSSLLAKLIRARPSVLSIPDGRQLETSLIILLKHKPNDVETVRAILKEFPASVATQDRHSNTPLHIACSKGASLKVVEELLHRYPAAVNVQNFHGLTPLQLLQHQSGALSETVATYLWDQVQVTELHMQTQGR